MQQNASNIPNDLRNAPQYHSPAIKPLRGISSAFPRMEALDEMPKPRKHKQS